METYFGCLLERSMYGDHILKTFISVYVCAYSYKTCRQTSRRQIKWRQSWNLSWLPWKPPVCQMSTLAENKLQTSPDTIQPRNALDKKCTQMPPMTLLILLTKL